MSSRQRAGRPSAWVVMVVLAAVAPRAAAETLSWSAPALVAESSASIGESTLAADASGTLHLIWSLNLGSDPRVQQVQAADWDGSAWSAPSTIVESSTAEAPSLAADPYGELHLVWMGPTARLQYTRARAAAPATRPAAWRSSVAIADSNTRAHLLADGEGRLHLAYPGHDATGVFYRTSDDGGATWSDPVLVAQTSGADAAADYVRLAVGEGVIDVVWSEYQLPRAAPALGVFHARSTDGGTTWFATSPLAGAEAAQANLARLDVNTVHVVFNGTAQRGGRFHTWTEDGGRTWSPVTQVLARGTYQGQPQLAVDSAGTLHLVTATGDGAWHLAWDGEQWSAPQCLSCASATAPGGVWEPSLAIVGGNRLEAVYRVGDHHLWHATASSSAPPRDPPPLRTIDWTSSRLWHRQLEHVPLLLAMIASVFVVRGVRLWRARRARAST